MTTVGLGVTTVLPKHVLERHATAKEGMSPVKQLVIS